MYFEDPIISKAERLVDVMEASEAAYEVEFGTHRLGKNHRCGAWVRSLRRRHRRRGHATASAHYRGIDVGNLQGIEIDVFAPPVGVFAPNADVSQNEALHAVLGISLELSRQTRRDHGDVLQGYVSKEGFPRAVARGSLFAVPQPEQEGRPWRLRSHPGRRADSSHLDAPDRDVLHRAGIIPVALELDGPRVGDLENTEHGEKHIVVRF